MRAGFIFVILCVGLVSASPSSFRLIEFNETERVWMSQIEVESLALECGKPDQAKKHGGFMDVTDHRNLNPMNNVFYGASVFPDSLSHQAYVYTLIPLLSKDSLKAFNDKLASYPDRKYNTNNGQSAAQYIYNQFQSIKSASGRTDITVSLFAHSWTQSSVIAQIIGSSNQRVIIGAHEDSTSNAATAPGADDDASGTATVLELFRTVVASGYKPTKTLEFHTYSAEEVGLKGSQAIASNYQSNQVNVYSMLQFDMTFFVGKSNNPRFGIITDYVDASLTNFLRKLVVGYSDLSIVESKCGYGCSDHASWTKAGYAAAFPFETTFEESNPNIHTKNDVADILSLDHGMQFAQVGLGYLIELSA